MFGNTSANTTSLTTFATIRAMARSVALRARILCRSVKIHARDVGAAQQRPNVVFTNNCPQRLIKEQTEPMKLISPHGGTLVNREVNGLERERLFEASKAMPRLILNARAISDLEMIATGAYSPLEGFMLKADYEAVVAHMRLPHGLPCSIPITLPFPPKIAVQFR